MNEQRGQGNILVTPSARESLGCPDTPEQWHSALCLPADYTVEAVELQGQLLCLRVSAPDIPVVDEGELLPSVECYYRRENGVGMLDRIELWRQYARTLAPVKIAERHCSQEASK